MAVKPYTVEKKINGKTYKAQFNGISAGVKAIDDSYIEGSSNISMEKLASYVFENVIVDPAGLEMDDFETMDEFQEVVKFGQQVMQGKFRNKVKGTDKG